MKVVSEILVPERVCQSDLEQALVKLGGLNGGWRKRRYPDPQQGVFYKGFLIRHLGPQIRTRLRRPHSYMGYRFGHGEARCAGLMQAAGIPVPDVYGYASWFQDIRCTAEVVAHECLSAHRTLLEALQQAEGLESRLALLARADRLIRLMIDAGFFHTDIHPVNLMLGQTDSDDRVIDMEAIAICKQLPPEAYPMALGELYDPPTRELISQADYDLWVEERLSARGLQGEGMETALDFYRRVRDGWGKRKLYFRYFSGGLKK